MSNMVVRTNVFALNAHRNLKNVGVDQSRASNRLASGYRINTAADDAAGLAISEAMRAQIRGLDQASRNAQDGQALINTAEGGMQEIHNMLQRIRELTVQAANDTNTEDNRADHISLEIDQLLQEITSMANRVQYNGMTLLNGDFARGADRYQFSIDITQFSATQASAAHALLPGYANALSDGQTATLNRFLSSVEFSNIITAISGTGGPTAGVGAINFAADSNFPGNVLLHELTDDLRSLIGIDGTPGFNTAAELQSFLIAVADIASEVVVPKAVTGADVAVALSVNTPTAATGVPGAGGAAGMAGMDDRALAALVDWLNGIGGIDPAPNGPAYRGTGTTTATGITVATHLTGAPLLALEEAGVISSAAHGEGVWADADALVNWINGYAAGGSGVTAGAGQAAAFDLRTIMFGTAPVDGIEAQISQGVDRLAFQVGANSGQLMRTSIADMRMVDDNGNVALGSLGHAMEKFVKGWEDAFSSDINTADRISEMIDVIQGGIEFVSHARAELGAVSNRLDFTGRSLDISSENLSDAESRVRNADMAREMMRFTMSNVLQQASVSMLAQANQMPNNLLQLLR